MPTPLLLCVVGPTGVGKTEVGIRLAQRYGTEILSIDARQVYADIPIGTNQPTAAERQMIPHHLVGFLPLKTPYSVARFETDALRVLAGLFAHQSVAVAVGGTGLYLKALVEGYDPIPEVALEIRSALRNALSQGGLAPLVAELRSADPQLAAGMDLQNPARVLRALEVIRSTGQPFSSFRRRQRPERPFRTVGLGLSLPRTELYARIDARTETMMAVGWLAEIEALRRREVPADAPGLQAIGYRELYRVLDGELSLEGALKNIRQQTRNYAKRQLTWFRNQHSLTWFHPAEESAIFAFTDTHVRSAASCC